MFSGAMIIFLLMLLKSGLIAKKYVILQADTSV